MSMSREIALASENPEHYAEIMSVLARKIIAEGGSRRKFDRLLRNVFTTLHRAGFSKDRLKSLRNESRVVYRKEAQRSPGPIAKSDCSQHLPVEKFVTIRTWPAEAQP
jgi:hypothetical protein